MAQSVDIRANRVAKGWISVCVQALKHSKSAIKIVIPIHLLLPEHTSCCEDNHHRSAFYIWDTKSTIQNSPFFHSRKQISEWTARISEAFLCSKEREKIVTVEWNRCFHPKKGCISGLSFAIWCVSFLHSTGRQFVVSMQADNLGIVHTQYLD